MGSRARTMSARLRACGASIATAAFLLMGACAPARAGQGSIPISVRSAAGVQGAPVFIGIPFPPGECDSLEQIALFSGEQPVPRQVKALSHYADGTIRVALVGFTATVAPGSTLTGEVRYGQGAGTPLQPELPWSRTPAVLAMASPRWYGESGVFNLRFLAAGENTLFPAFDEKLRAQYAAVADPPAMTDPDYRGYYDHFHALYATLLRTGGPESAPARIWNEARQYREDEILHTGPYRGQYHAGSRITNSSPMLLDSIRRAYPLGLLEDYYFTGDERSLAVAREIGDALAQDVYLDAERFLVMERQPGLALAGLCALYEGTLDRRYLDAARHLAEIVVRHQAAMAVRYPDQSGVSGQTGAFVQDYGGRWYDPEESDVPASGSPWMTALLGEGLIRLYWITGEPRLRQSILDACDWMVDAGFAPAADRRNQSGQDGFWYIAADPADTTVYPALNPMHLEMLGFAHQATGDPKYLAVAQRILAVNDWGRSIKEFNQGMRTSGQGLHLLQHAPGELPLTLAASGLRRDAAPPVPPVGLTPLVVPGGIELAWSGVEDPELAGYNVYRALSAGGPYARINADPVRALGFADGTAQAGSPYWYRVTALDVNGNESAASAPAGATAGAVPGQLAITGTVLLEGIGQPGVTVSAGGQSAVTGPDGSYAIRGLVAGTYVVTASASGFTYSAPVSLTLGPGGGSASFTAGSSWIFRDRIAPGWTAAGARGRASLKATEPVAEEVRSVAVTLSGKRGSVLLSGPGISVAGKSTLRMFVHGGRRGRQQLRVQVLVDGTARRTVDFRAYGGLPKANQWKEYAIPLTALGATSGSVTGVRFSAVARQPVLYVDCLRLE